MNASKIMSLGELADRWHVPLTAVEAAVRKLGLMPAVTINGIGYYDEEKLRRLKAMVEDLTLSRQAARAVAATLRRGADQITGHRR